MPPGFTMIAAQRSIQFSTHPHFDVSSQTEVHEWSSYFQHLNHLHLPTMESSSSSSLPWLSIVTWMRVLSLEVVNPNICLHINISPECAYLFRDWRLRWSLCIAISGRSGTLDSQRCCKTRVTTLPAHPHPGTQLIQCNRVNLLFQYWPMQALESRLWSFYERSKGSKLSAICEWGRKGPCRKRSLARADLVSDQMHVLEVIEWSAYPDLCTVQVCNLWGKAVRW